MNRTIPRSHYDLMETRHKAWFPLDRKGIMKSCDSSRFWLIEERLITTEMKNLAEIGSYLQAKRFLSLILTNLRSVMETRLNEQFCPLSF